MSNRLPWFKHWADAYDQAWLRHLIRTQGHEVSSVYWSVMETVFEHGKGDKVERNLQDLAQRSIVSTRVFLRILSEMAKPFEGKVRIVFKRKGQTLSIQYNNFRKRQEKSGSKTPAKPPAKPDPDPSITPLEEEGEGEGEEDSNNDQSEQGIKSVLGDPGFMAFIAEYHPKKRGDRIAAAWAWRSLKPDAEIQAQILRDLRARKKSEEWLKEDGRWVPSAENYLKRRKWEESVERCLVCTTRPQRKGSKFCELCAQCKDCASSTGPWHVYTRTDGTKFILCPDCAKGGPTGLPKSKGPEKLEIPAALKPEETV